MNEVLYLDYAATWPPFEPEILQAQQIYFENFANSSGRNKLSQNATRIIENSRENILRQFGLKDTKLIFTSSASESNNLVLHLLKNIVKQKKILVSPFEHPSILEKLKTEQSWEIFYIPLLFDNNKYFIGFDFDAVKKIITEQGIEVVVCMHAHNESGIIFEVEKLISTAQSVNNEVYFLIDFSQTLPKCSSQNITSFVAQYFLSPTKVIGSFSGHKIGAGFGLGLLVFSPTIDLKPLTSHAPLKGGSQEYGLRASSHHLAAIVAFDLTLQKRLADHNFYPRLQKISTEFEQKLLHELTTVMTEAQVIGQNNLRHPGVTLLLLPDVQLDFLLIALDHANIFLSTGTSCKSKSRTPSPALLAMGYSESQAMSVIRVSYGVDFNGEKQKFFIDTLLKNIPLCRT